MTSHSVAVEIIRIPFHSEREGLKRKWSREVDCTKYTLVCTQCVLCYLYFQNRPHFQITFSIPTPHHSNSSCTPIPFPAFLYFVYFLPSFPLWLGFMRSGRGGKVGGIRKMAEGDDGVQREKDWEFGSFVNISLWLANRAKLHLAMGHYFSSPWSRFPQQQKELSMTKVGMNYGSEMVWRFATSEASPTV